MISIIINTTLAIIILVSQTVWASSDVSQFLGPLPGETINIKSNSFGITKRRICTKINDDGSYAIEEWTKLPKVKKISPEDRARTKLPQGVSYADDLPDETMYCYNLAVENGQLIFNKGKKNENIILDLNNKEWSQYIWSSAGKIKADYIIVKEEEKVVLGKLRQLVHVKYSFDLAGMHCEELYAVASGLGIIYTESLAPGSNKITSTLVEE
ncbi:hypothetical protein [Maridesulfovibrio zosterae]|uniref:hypothetical protein n=1 Tax=Maridesulfovibrio zosterae TaxID=82171 RepID=UPI0003F90F17|nr:hypothetical protein [Maridesulfovibrio zosterae]